MRKYLSGLLALICLMGLAACGGQAKQEDVKIPEDQFAVDIICDEGDISQISYTAYIGGEYRLTGGQVILDSGTEEVEHMFCLRFSSGDFEEGDDMAQFSISLSSIGADGRENKRTTGPVDVPAECGASYTIMLSEDSGSYAAELL